jgi:hypothetical protein
LIYLLKREQMRQKERPFNFFKNLEDREERVKTISSKEEKNAAPEFRQQGL